MGNDEIKEAQESGGSPLNGGLDGLKAGNEIETSIEWQYFFNLKECKAKHSTSPECICWHDEGTGVYKDEAHDKEPTIVEWRIKPHNAKLRSAGND